MHSSLLRLASAFLMLNAIATAQDVAKTSTTVEYSDEGVVFERYEQCYRMHADGTGERANHVLLKIQSESAARQFSVLSFGYASADETPHIDLVRVHKADGTAVDTPASDAIEMPAEVTRAAPLYSDLKEKHVPVRSLSPGDTLEYDVHTTVDKAEAPGQFWGVHHFTAPGTTVVRAEVLTLEVPKDKYVQVWSPNHKPEVTEHDGLRRYVWNVAQLVPAPKKAGPSQADEKEKKDKKPKDPDEDADGHALPSVAWTTFHTWAEVGDWYRSLAMTRAMPNDSLRARAGELTKDARTPEDQARAIYEFVTTHIRYVGIDFGVGRYQPHAAAEVLANQYGDCKDKDTLLEALLRAKGFKTAPALIGAGITPTSDVPSPATFNHVITTVNLPDGQIWLDSTPEVAPYRYLSANLRDEQALVVPVEGTAALQKTPAEPPYPLQTKFESTGTLDAEGKFIGKMTATYRTDDEVYVRSMARSLAPGEWDKASQYLSSVTGFGGTTSGTRFVYANDLSKPIEISYDYAKHPYGDWDNRRIVPPFPLLELGLLEDDKTEPDSDIEFGAPRTVVAMAHIRLPDGFHTDVPDPVHVKTDFITFDKTYSFDGKELTIERTVVYLKKKLPKSDWKRYQTFTKDIGLASEPWIQLIPPARAAIGSVSGTTIPVPITKAPLKNAKPSANSGPIVVQLPSSDSRPPARDTENQTDNATVDDLIRSAAQHIMSRDFEGAKALLDKVKQKNPQQVNLSSMYGTIALMEGKTAEAILAMQSEVAAHPDNDRAVMMLAETQKRNGDSLGAGKSLQSYLDRHPENVTAAMYLASLQTNAEDKEGALRTLQKAAEQNPENRSLKIEISRSLVKLDRRDEASAAVRSAIDGCDDPATLNNAADTMAEIGLNFSLAEETSLKSIQALEEKSATITTAEVNSSAFTDSNLLISAWDTLGWVLFHEDKLDAARPFLEASWRNNLHRETGDRLGQLLEAMGQKDEALSIYLLASASSEHGSDVKQADKHIADSVARLKKAGAKVATRNAQDELQNSRTYKLTGYAGVSGWGTFRLQVTTAGVIGARQMTGEPKLAPLARDVGAMKFPELLPPDSKAHLLLSAVVSCSSYRSCEVVLVPDSDLRTEQY